MTAKAGSNAPRRAPQVFDADDPEIHRMPDPPPGPEPEPASVAPQPADDDDAPLQPPPATLKEQVATGIRWGSILVSTAVGLVTLAAGLWFTRFVSVAVARDDWIGWIAKGAAILIAVALTALLLKELFGFLRLARLSRIRRAADRAVAMQDRALEVEAVSALRHLTASRPDAKWALARFREKERYQSAPGALLGLADTVLLAEPDKEARRVIFESARRVAVVTAVVPIAFISVFFVLFENIRMVRRLAAAYGGRPGFLGGVRLLWRVIAYVAATGAVILTDDLFGQFLGQDIVRRLSRRLGEGTFNGALTARLGIAAINLCRPLPFIAAKPPRTRHIVRELFPELSAADLVRGRFTSRGKRQTRAGEAPGNTDQDGPSQ